MTFTPKASSLLLFFASIIRSMSKSEIKISIFSFLHISSRNGIYSSSYISGDSKALSATLIAVVFISEFVVTILPINPRSLYISLK